MGMFPCTNDSPHRFKGKAGARYVHLVKDGMDLGAKTRLCPTHAGQTQTWADEHMVLVAIGDAFDDEPLQASLVCNLCGKGQSEYGLYLHLYQAGQEKREYFADVCEGCRGSTVQRFTLTP